MFIQCSECGKQFSDKAKACTNCGCPVELINRENVCCINGIFYDLTNIYHILPKPDKGQRDAAAPSHIYSLVLELTDLDMISADKLAKIIFETNRIPETFGNVTFNILNPDKRHLIPKIVKCPECNTTSIGTISGEYTFYDRYLEHGLPQNVCQNCGYSWYIGE